MTVQSPIRSTEQDCRLYPRAEISAKAAVLSELNSLNLRPNAKVVILVRQDKLYRRVQIQGQARDSRDLDKGDYNNILIAATSDIAAGTAGKYREISSLEYNWHLIWGTQRARISLLLVALAILSSWVIAFAPNPPTPGTAPETTHFLFNFHIGPIKWIALATADISLVLTWCKDAFYPS
jgi:hypothetical protein